MDYASKVSMESKTHPGVSYGIARMTFGRRIELTRQVRELARKMSFHQAGEALVDGIEASLLSAEIDKCYLQWGLLQVSGLHIDGREADTQALIESGPESLCNEIAAAIKAECGLTEVERKN